MGSWSTAGRPSLEGYERLTGAARFERDLVAAFGEIAECATVLLESLRDRSANPGPNCQDFIEVDLSESACRSMPEYTVYLARKRRCAELLYCDDGQESTGDRCDAAVDCGDGSDEAGCD